jgi:hypothetical protein
MLRFVLRLCFVSLLWVWGAPLQGQHVESPLVPRGQFYFRTEPSTLKITGILSDSGEDLPLGAYLFVPELESDVFPALDGISERIAELTGTPASPFSVGGTTGRFSANEQVWPLRLDYGVLDRVSVGVTMPLVKKRVNTLLRLSTEGAEIGMNPRQRDAEVVDGFMQGAQTALSVLQSSVTLDCTTNGETAPSCVSGRALVSDSEGVLLSLNGAYMEDAYFPLQGSGSGSQIAGRWSQLRTSMNSWGAAAPEALPLSTTPLTDAVFRELLGEVWSVEGFPFETPQAFMQMGDVELHLSVGILNIQPEPVLAGLPIPPVGLRVQSAVQGTVRFPTPLRSWRSFSMSANSASLTWRSAFAARARV